MNKRIKRTPEEQRENMKALAEALDKRDFEEQERKRLVEEARKIKFDVDLTLFRNICKRGSLEYMSPEGKWDVSFSKNDILNFMTGGVVSKDCGQKILEFKMVCEITRDQKISILKFSTLYHDLANLVE